MDIPQSVHWAGTLAPVALMATAAAASLLPQRSDAGRWRLFQAFSVGALVLVVLTLVSGAGLSRPRPSASAWLRWCSCWAR